MARDDFDPNELDKDELLKQLGDPGGGAPTSNTMPVAYGGGPAAPLETLPAIPTPAPTRTPTTASTFQGFTPKHAMEGFEFGREQNTGKSAKDAFASLANAAPPPPLNDKAALGQWFNQYIKPGMNELGHGAQDATGDKFRFKNWQGEYDVDFGRGAGAEGGALAWQADDVNGAPLEAQAGAAAGAGGSLASPPPQSIEMTAPAQGPQTPDAPPDALAAILAEIQALQNGGQSPMDSNALMQLLGGGR